MKNKKFVTEGATPLNEVKLQFHSAGVHFECMVADKISPDIALMHLAHSGLYYRKARAVNKTLPMRREIKRAIINKFSTGAPQYKSST